MIRGNAVPDRLEIGVPVLSRGIQKIQQASADAVDRRNLEFARPDRLVECSRLQRVRARHDVVGVVDVQSDGAHARPMGDVMRMREAVGLAIDDEFNLALGPTLDGLAAMLAGFAKAELAKQAGEIGSLGLVDGKFQKPDTVAVRFRFESIRRALGAFGRQLILQQDQRPQPVGGGARGRAGTQLVVDDLERERHRMAGRDHGLHKTLHGQIALPRKASEMPAPGQDVETKLRRVGQLNQKYLVRWNGLNGGDRKRGRKRMKTVENDTDRFVVGASHDLPCIAIIVDMPSPGEGLEADAQTAPGSQLAEITKIGGGPIDSSERVRRNVAAYQQQVGLQFLHHVKFAFGPRKIARTLRLGHTLEIAERLERANLKADIATEPPDVARASAKR